MFVLILRILSNGLKQKLCLVRREYSMLRAATRYLIRKKINKANYKSYLVSNQS